MPEEQYILWLLKWCWNLLNSLKKGINLSSRLCLVWVPITPESQFICKLSLGLRSLRNLANTLHTSGTTTAGRSQTVKWLSEGQWMSSMTELTSVWSLTSQVHWCQLRASVSSWCCTPPRWRSPEDKAAMPLQRFNITLKKKRSD